MSSPCRCLAGLRVKCLSLHRGQDSDRHAPRHATSNLQQIGLHVDDLVLAVPCARKEVLEAVGLETDGAVDEAVLIGAGEAIIPQSLIRFLPPPLVLTVAKLAYRRVTRKAAISGWRPFRVLSPVLATTSSIALRLEVSVSARRATQLRHVCAPFPARLRPKLSVVSVSRAVRVIGCCERSIGPIRHGCER